MKLLSHVSNSQLLRQHSHINGAWLEGEEHIHVDNPATNESICEVTLLNKAQILDATEAAQSAYETWRLSPLNQRHECLQNWHDLILENKEDLARIMTFEQGKPIAEARGEIDYAASFITWFAEQAKRLNGAQIPSHIAASELGTRIEPIGVVALITPWNFPCAMITRKAAAALAAGCSAIIKPACETPLSALALAHLAKQAGFPKGVFNVVLSKGSTFTDVMATSDTIRAISFTGSTRVGKLILHACADTVKKSAMELGGNAPLIVTADTQDIDKAVDIAIGAKFATSGQDCLAANRLFVHQNIYDTFIEKFTARVRALKVAHGIEPDSDIGPLINEQACDNTDAIVQDAISHGAKVLCGGEKHALGANFYTPTVLTEVTPQMRIYQEENFAPIAGIIRYAQLDDVIKMANDTQYGLAAYIISDNVNTINHLLRELEFGMIAINTVKMTGPPVPFGGMKHSGLGREGSEHGFEPFTEIKYYCLKVA